MELTLGQLSAGERVVVTGYHRGERAVRERLLSLGLTRGTDVTVVRAAPAGGPLQIHARGTALVLRRADASSVRVMRSVGMR